MRLERLSERLAEEGHLEAPEIMLDERHLGLQRVLSMWSKRIGSVFDQWRATAKSRTQSVKREVVLKLCSTLNTSSSLAEKDQITNAFHKWHKNTNKKAKQIKYLTKRVLSSRK